MILNVKLNMIATDCPYRQSSNLPAHEEHYTNGTHLRSKLHPSRTVVMMQRHETKRTGIVRLDGADNRIDHSNDSAIIERVCIV